MIWNEGPISMKRKQSIVDQRHVALTFGILLLTTITALETLAVTTIASTIAKELGGIALYSWIFSASLLAQMVGTVVAGYWADQRGIKCLYLACNTRAVCSRCNCSTTDM